MALPDDFWTRNLEDEPCDRCGARPSKHEGHGSFTCKACYDKRWCPKCKYMLKSRYRPSEHVCPDEAERHRLANEEAELLEWLQRLETR